MNTRNANVIIPPSDEPSRSQFVLLANVFLMTFGLLAFAVALGAGFWRIFGFLTGDIKDVSAITLFAQVVSLGLLFVLGWGSSFLSIQILKNGFYPYILLAAGVCVSLGMVVIYGMGMIKCYNERQLGIEKYIIVFLAGYLVLVSFYLLTEKARLIFMAAPLGVAVVLHIFLLVFHYVLWGAVEPRFVYVDLELMIIIMALLGLMAAPAPYKPFRQAINAIARMASTALPSELKSRVLPGPQS